MGQQRRITSADVARASGVSRATVSYVLNNDQRQRIPAETRERVLAAARELGYQPSAAARVLRSGYSRLVLAVLPFEQVDPALARHIKTLEAKLAEQGYTLIWYIGRGAAESPVHPAANLTPAVVLSYGEATEPVDESFLDRFNAPVLKSNHPVYRQAVGRLQASYLHERGWRRMVFAAPDRGDVQLLAQDRLAGVREGCAALGIDPPLVVTVPGGRAAARAAIAGLLADHPPPLGFCCYNDEIAFGVLAALADLGLTIGQPESHAAVIGCDDIPLAALGTPALTTISIDHHPLHDHLVAQILAVIAGEPAVEAPPVPLQLVARDSA